MEKEAKEMKSTKEKNKFIHEFKEFIFKGNVFDLALGVIIGGAFSKIVSSLVGDIIMPALSLLTGAVDFSSLKFEQQITDTMKIQLTYGNFIQTVFDFLIISLCLFLVVKAVNKFRKQEEKKEEVVAKPSKEEELLTEIRDILKKK